MTDEQKEDKKMADNLAKRPSKGILKNSSSFDKPEGTNSNTSSGRRKSKETKWDEMNIIATLHPADKDYGHMKIDEPKTPYNYSDEDLLDKDELDAELLAEKIRNSTDAGPKYFTDENPDEESEEDDDLTEEEKARRKEFLAKRKKHYNEYYAVKLARKQLEEEISDEEEDENTGEMEVEKETIKEEEKPSQPNANTSANPNSGASTTIKCFERASSLKCPYRRSRSNSPNP